MAESGKPSPGKALLLGLLSPSSGYLYVGRKRRGQVAHLIAFGLMSLTATFWNLPPINLPMLILIALPPVALILWWFTVAVGAAIEAGKTDAEAEELPLGQSSPPMLIAGIVLNLSGICGMVILVHNFNSIGTVTTPNDDMAPTTLEGDFLVTWKDYYKDRLPERGDVAVVQLPGVEGDRIMRIVGLPGDSLLGVLGVLTINGKPIGRDGDGDFSWRDAAGTHRNAPRYVETLPGGSSYRILQSAEGMFTGTLLGASLRIPDGHYFVVGDNRDSSKSSWDFGMLPGLVLGDRPTVILSSSRSSLIGRSVQP